MDKWFSGSNATSNEQSRKASREKKRGRKKKVLKVPADVEVPAPASATCPRCGRLHQHGHGSWVKSVLLKDGRRITARIPRFQCLYCGRTWSAPHREFLASKYPLLKPVVQLAKDVAGTGLLPVARATRLAEVIAGAKKRVIKSDTVRKAVDVGVARVPVPERVPTEYFAEKEKTQTPCGKIFRKVEWNWNHKDDLTAGVIDWAYKVAPEQYRTKSRKMKRYQRYRQCLITYWAAYIFVAPPEVTSSGCFVFDTSFPKINGRQWHLSVFYDAFLRYPAAFCLCRVESPSMLDLFFNKCAIHLLARVLVTDGDTKYPPLVVKHFPGCLHQRCRVHASKPILKKLRELRLAQGMGRGERLPKKVYEAIRKAVKKIFDLEGVVAKLAQVKAARDLLPESYVLVDAMLAALAERIEEFPLGKDSGAHMLDTNLLEGFWSRIWMYGNKVGDKKLETFLRAVGGEIVNWFLFNARLAEDDRQKISDAACRFLGLVPSEFINNPPSAGKEKSESKPTHNSC